MHTRHNEIEKRLDVLKSQTWDAGAHRCQLREKLMMNTSLKDRSRFSTKSVWILAIVALFVSAAAYAASKGMFSGTGTVTAVQTVDGDLLISVDMDDGSKALIGPLDGSVDVKTGYRIEIHADAAHAASKGMFRRTGTVTAVQTVDGDLHISVDMDDGSKAFIVVTDGSVDVKAGDKIQIPADE